MEMRWRTRIIANTTGMPSANTQSDTTAPGTIASRAGLSQLMLGSDSRYNRPDASAVHAKISTPLRSSTK